MQMSIVMEATRAVNSDARLVQCRPGADLNVWLCDLRDLCVNLRLGVLYLLRTP